MRLITKIIKLMLLVVLTASCSIAQYKKNSDTIPISVIKSSIDKYAKNLSPQLLKDLGLKDKGELLSLKPGFQYKYFMIGVDDIKKYKQGDDINPLIKEYPAIEVGLEDATGKIVIAIGFVKQDNNWAVATFGLTPNFNNIRNSQKIIGYNTLKKGVLIRVPGLELDFIAVPAHNSELSFIALKDDPALNLKRGYVQSGSNAIWNLAKDMKNKY